MTDPGRSDSAIERQAVIHGGRGDIRARMNGDGPVEGIWLQPLEGALDGDGEIYLSIDDLYGLMCEFNLLGRFG